MGRKRKQVALPDEGMAYAVPLEDGRFGACRVLRKMTPEEAQSAGANCVLVACSAWIGNQVPDMHDPGLRPILHLTHHSWKNKPEILWVSESPPADFALIGTIEPSSEERATECFTYGGWASLRIQPLAQWRWDNEREAVMAEDASKQEHQRQVQAQQRKHRRELLATTSLEELLEHRFFPQWKTHPPKKAEQACRRIMADTVLQLHELGNRASESERLVLLQKCIEAINAIDEQMGYFIETIEREDICEEFEKIVHACGLGAHQDLADQWRDW